jgi:hypothetical protein
MIRDTSIDSYYRCVAEGIVTGRQVEVLDLIIATPMRTDREYAELLGVDDPNYVRPRRKELVDLGLITHAGKRVCSVTGRRVYVWKWDNTITFAKVLDNQRVITEYATERIIDGVITRTIVSMSLMEVVAKAMLYVEIYGIKRKGLILKEAAPVYKKDGRFAGVYKAIITREKK